ncbi:hypothetical protein CHS0354_024389 [Potamilus streckersoni]|uniref:Uncharacterized protein n=1 Tax=Potamilus streckersoni TaxID=2493646 RepID=A0AAE0SWY2_9BIVA|nr:hypothetical protein CHS0354_024389 [Potamilus streckersoni]
MGFRRTVSHVNRLKTTDLETNDRLEFIKACLAKRRQYGRNSKSKSRSGSTKIGSKNTCISLDQTIEKIEIEMSSLIEIFESICLDKLIAGLTTGDVKDS